METKLMAIAIALFTTSCGLETEGVGESNLDTTPEVAPDAEPDVVEEDDAGPDEVARDVPETTEENAADDVAEDAEPEDASEATDEGRAEDGETEPEDGGIEDGEAEDGEPDPCALPEIPTTGIFVFYCFDYDLLSPFALEFQVEQGGLPVVSWRGSPECTFSSPSRRLECALTPTVWDATYIFNIRYDPGIGIGWSCGPELLEIWGAPRAWFEGIELPVEPVPNGDGGCNHRFLTPPS